jgi:hypothetical protein
MSIIIERFHTPRMGSKKTKEKLNYKTTIKRFTLNIIKVLSGWKKTYYANSKLKNARVAVLISDKVYFKTKIITRDRIFHYDKVNSSK